MPRGSLRGAAGPDPPSSSCLAPRDVRLLFLYPVPWSPLKRRSPLARAPFFFFMTPSLLLAVIRMWRPRPRRGLFFDTCHYSLFVFTPGTQHGRRAGHCSIRPCGWISAVFFWRCFVRLCMLFVATITDTRGAPSCLAAWRSAAYVSKPLVHIRHRSRSPPHCDSAMFATLV